ncbi:MAG: citrate/2-methylcitrate synthase [Oscillospiraceae bacterium]|nr:citrate/2-methylcitrate synthase [Oscillospiraceae bacterium]
MSEIFDAKLKEALNNLFEEQRKNNYINPEYYRRFDVKRGLRNADSTGVLAGLTKVCSVEGYYIEDGERVPKDGKLIYRGINIEDIISNCEEENRFGYEEVIYLLLFGVLPTENQLNGFKQLLANLRELPEDFVEDMIMKVPSKDIMNKVARCVLALYSYDDDPDNTDPANVLRQSIQLIAQIPVIMANSYQVKRRAYDKKSMFFHQNNPKLGFAESILRSIRADKQFTDEEAKLLDICLILHADHGGGNNSTFTTRCITSSGTDTYSAIAAGIGSLKGPKHGGANLRVVQMVDDIKENLPDYTNEAKLREYLNKILNKQAGDRSGLIYGMGHAVYTLSDPRARILKGYAEKFAKENGREDHFELLSLIEKLTPSLLAEHRGSNKKVCANVDLYSGFLYEMLGIPRDLFTPLFMSARVAGWSAHRIEEITSNGKIVRPAYKNVNVPRPYVPITERAENLRMPNEYISIEER